MKKINYLFSLFLIIMNLLIFHNSFSQVNQQWVSRYNAPGSSEDHANSIAVDNLSNVYVTGYSYGTDGYNDYVTIKYNSEGILLWITRYNGTENSDDVANSIALDSSGNVYVTGYSYGPSGYSDYATIKYNSAGIQQWVARYSGPSSSSFNTAVSIAVDYSGNVCVTGLSSVTIGDLSDFATIKYNSSGDSIWVRRYNGPGNSYDDASSLSIDKTGNVYVTGSSYGNGTQSDYATIKYNSAGIEQWVNRYNGPGNSNDESNSIAVDNSGNAFVTGYINSGVSTGTDYATIKYNSAGIQQWIETYTAPGNSADEAISLALDNSGNVLVTGSSEFDYTTIKYNTSGIQQWVANYNGPWNSFDDAISIAADYSGNVYVTGESYGSGTLKDYATVKYNSAGIQQWVNRYNGPGNDYDNVTSIATDGSGNVYVTGQSDGSGTFADIATIKYDPAGDSLWVARYNGPGSLSDVPTSMAADETGNVYVTGYSGNIPAIDYYTIKINSAGDIVWTASFTTPGYFQDIANSVAVDKYGNIYVTGESYGEGLNPSDFATIKYNSAGAQQWVKRYNGGVDIGRLISVDSSGNIYVSGVSNGDYATIKYNSSGDSLWVKRYNGPGNYNDMVNSMIIDDSGYVYVTGSSDGNLTGKDFATIKYSSSGDSLWVARYNLVFNDIANAICIDKSGNVYVTGESYGYNSGTDYATIKYNSMGIQQWVARYSGQGIQDDGAVSIGVDDSGNVYVTGHSYETGTTEDFATVKYNSAGIQQWVSRYNGIGDSRDKANSLSVDSSGNVYVTGVSEGIGSGYDYTTIKYNSSGIQQWIEKYNGPGNSDDEAISIISEETGNVYVTGASKGIGTNWDYATIKYFQTTGINQIAAALPEHFFLSQNFPNPFNPSTFINYELLVTSYAKLAVYDIMGREVMTLVNEKQSPGTYQVEFSATGGGSGLPSGVYFYRLTVTGGAGEFTDTKRMMLVK